MNGDREALNFFYQRFAPRMLGVIKRYVADDMDAEDILHDGFIVAFTRLSSLRDYDRVDYWLATIMKNLSLQFLHSQDVAVILHEIPEMAETPEIDNLLDLETLESLILKLPPGYQKVFRLAVLEGKSHKEIGAILGIAPNSSSSQLCHAKMMMRKLITDYRKQTGLLSLLLVAVAGFLLWKNYGVDTQDTLSLSELNIPEKTKPVSVAKPTVEKSFIASAKSNNLSKPLSALSPASASSPVDKESASEKSEPSAQNHPSVETNSDEMEVLTEPAPEHKQPAPAQEHKQSASAPECEYPVEEVLPMAASHSQGWSVNVGVNPGISPFQDLSQDDADYDWPGACNPGDPPSDNVDEQPAIQKLSASGLDYNDVSHHNYMPVAFSVSVSKKMSQRISLESGLTYTWLHSKFEYGSARVHCHWHYLGIPLKLNVNIISSQKWRNYLSVGGEIDIPLYAKAVNEGFYSSLRLRTGRFTAYTAWSLMASYGVSFKVSDKVEIFVEPTLQYHFDHRHDVPNSWTDDPWGFSLPIGFRFTW